MALALDPERARAEALLREWRGDGDEAEEAREAMPAAPDGLRPGLFARYFAGMNMRQLVLERVDRTVDFDWQNDAPAPKVPRNRFSVRWEGYLKAPRSATYTFFLVANDGVHLTVGDKTVLKNWRNMQFKNWYGTKEVRLKAGWHPIRLEYFDAMGGARILLRASST